MTNSFTFHQIFCIFLFLGMATLSANAIDCTIADYAAQYSQCRPDLTRDLLWYKIRYSNCSGGLPTPSPVFDLPCNITCDVGEYLPLGELNCTACQPGTFTRGGGRVVDEWNAWSTYLGIFSTYCVNNMVANSPPINCSGWVLSGTYIRSGVITEVQSSILVLQTQLLIAGIVQFSYAVSAEPFYDGLIFYVDGAVVLPLTSVTSSYVDCAANLTAGYHTLMWVYYKDFSVDEGLDAAFIQSIEISGLTYAESSCTPCDPGSFQPDPASVQCSPCPLDSYANVSGSPSCPPCPDGQYSFVGASECTQKNSCTASDYQILYGTCTSDNTRSATAYWLQPQICDDTAFPLPVLSSVPCATCPPGTAPDPNFGCVACATGTYSIGGSAQCQACPAGNAAAKVLTVDSFDSWFSGQSTYCTGYCGSGGWRLRSNFIDSGAGHGDTVSSVLTMNVTLEQAGFITFTFLLNCTRFCTLTFFDSPYEVPVFWNPDSITINSQYTYTSPVALEVGPHEFAWIFSEDASDPTPNNRTDAARIFEITVNGTLNGGAATCLPCSNGTYTTVASSFCTNCTAGQSSNTVHTECDACAGNTFSPMPGGNCYDCGPTTVANAAATDCIDTCSFSLGGDLYDISAIAKQGPFGPVYGDIYTYYINLCGRGNFTAACVDEDYNPLVTHVCQVLPYGYALDVGWRTGYYSIPVTSAAPKGFRVHYDMGLLGCGPKNNGVAFPRNSDLTFICDPSAGLGSLQGLGTVESPPCHYNFVWRSLYACPVCTEAYYSFYVTTCDSSGKRQKVYYWNDPILCHDGVKLPATEQVDCGDSMVECGIGQQLGSDGQSCVPCPVGEYSVGGGLLISTWPTGSATLPYEYSTTCNAFPCTLWTSDDNISIHSGFGDSSLIGSHSLQTTGSVSFKYKLYSPTNGIFRFFVDGILQLEQANSLSFFEWIDFTYPLPGGSHTLLWEFINGLRYSPSLLTFQGVSISDIYIQGLDFHAETCLPCPDGTFSSDNTSVIGCLPCPANTFSTGQTDSCTPCPSDQYSFVGSAACIEKINCTSASYQAVYGDCGLDGTRVVTYEKILPDICIGGTGAPAPTTAPCAPCPPYTFRSNAVCVGCPDGQYFQDNLCVNNTPGYIVQHSQVYFGDDSMSTWPPLFYTDCSGVCGTDGWRITGAGIDSGYHGSNEVDSYVVLETNYVVDGSVTFTYSLSTSSPSNGFQFAIDNVVLPIEVPSDQSSPVTVQVNVSKGLHALLWNYHQETGTGVAMMSDIVLVGVEGAIGSSPGLPCAPGSFSNDPAALYCNLCAPGTVANLSGSVACSQCAINEYNPNYGAVQCLPCDLGSEASNPGSDQCQTTCIFPGNYDLQSIGPQTVYDNARRKFLINVCNNVVGVSSCPQSHSCIVNVDNSTIQAGSSLRFVLDPYNSTAIPFSIYFEHGDACPGSSSRQATLINFECDPNSPNSSPAFAGEDENCLSTFNWGILSACPLCTDNDYATVTGVCSGGRRKISKTRVTYCNGYPIIDVPDESCDSHEFPLGAILAVVFVFIGVVGLAAFIFFRNRRLAARYALLVDQTRTANVSL